MVEWSLGGKLYCRSLEYHRTKVNACARDTTESLLNNNELFPQETLNFKRLSSGNRQMQALASQVIQQIYYCISLSRAIWGNIQLFFFCIVPPFGRANTATVELNISPYCLPTHAIIIY